MFDSFKNIFNYHPSNNSPPYTPLSDREIPGHHAGSSGPHHPPSGNPYHYTSNYGTYGASSSQAAESSSHQHHGGRPIDHSKDALTIKGDIEQVMHGYPGSATAPYEMQRAIKDRKSIYNNIHPELSINEFVTLHLYTHKLSKPLNDMLKKNPDTLHSNQVAIAMNSGLRKLARNPNNLVDKGTTLYRGVGDAFTDQQAKKTFKKGNTFSDAGFLSTSKDQYNAEKYTQNVMFHIKAKNAVNFKSISTMPGENEAVLAPNTALKVEGSKKKGGVLHVNLKEK